MILGMEWYIWLLLIPPIMFVVGIIILVDKL